MRQPLDIADDWGVVSLANRLHAGEAAAPATVDLCLDRIGVLDGELHSFVHVADAHARVVARQERTGPLAGVPFAAKDTIDVAGMPCEAGSRLREGHVATVDAPIVRALHAAGAICLGKLACWEYGTGNGGEYFDLKRPPARNPWDLARATGGSSTGSGAAVAAGLVPFALGSDTTGSVRLPAAATGTVGMIPTRGRLSTEGLLPNCYTLDVPGVFAWTVEDTARVLATLLADPQLEARAAEPVAGLRVAVAREPGAGMPAADPALVEGIDAGLDVLASLGVELFDVRLPVAVADCFAATRMIGPTESAAIHEAELRTRPEAMGFALRDKLLYGSLVRAVDYVQAQRFAHHVAGQIDRLLRDYDALVTFGTLHLPPVLGVEPAMTAFTVDTMLTPFNLSGHPALVQCTGYSASGLPLHWQVVAKRGDEASGLRLARAYERATPWRRRRPPIVAALAEMTA